MSTKQKCIAALRDAARVLGHSPTKAEYEGLGMTPASATIMRVLGGWNAAKEEAGLETYEQGEYGGSQVQPKPEDVSIPEDVEWSDLSPHQRWYYKNRQRQAGKKKRRREALRTWLHQYKVTHCECERCGEDDPACLDFHHVEEKRYGIAEMVNRGFAIEEIEEEIGRCVVLCANCHRREHYETP